jgi:hypothetical protein
LGRLGDKNDQSLANVFSIALGELDGDGGDARHLLNILAFLHPAKIPESFLRLEDPPAGLEFLQASRSAE